MRTKNTDLKKQLKTSKCQYCGSQNNTKWIYCSNECIELASKRATNENRILHSMLDNAELKRQVFIEQIRLEGYTSDPTWNTQDIDENVE